MTAQILAAELTNLIQESKRKNPELRNAADKSLQDLKALPSTSEVQLAADLSRRPYFISPFLVGCNSRNAKFASPSLICLLRLAISRGLPRDRLKDILEALKECSALSLEIQLKVLQAVPSLVQNYASDIQDQLLNIVIEICSTLCGGKNPALTNTAAATLQQVIIAVFDKVASEDEKALEIPNSTEVPGDDGPIPVRQAAYDGYRVFHDLCLLAEIKKPRFLHIAALSQTTALDLIGAVLDNHEELISNHLELANILRGNLLPFIIRSLSEKTSFPIVLRVMRILDVVISQHLDIAPAECEIILGLLNYMLDPDAAAPWKRTLCLEVWRGIYSDSTLILGIFSRFDETEGKKNIVQDNISAFVRLATEKPALIGLGDQSTAPTGVDDSKDSSGEQAAAGAGAMAEIIGGSIGTSTVSSAGKVGLSTQWSSPRTACLEQLDKSEPPALPDTYIHSLILTCINNISESLAKFILPLTVHNESRGKKRAPKTKQTMEGDTPEPPLVEAAEAQATPNRPFRSQSYFRKAVPVNPLSLESHTAYHAVASTANLIRECWPAVLATSSTFLYATLDADYYRTLVRSMQKFTQVAGLLRLSTPRDAFLTTLGKAAVPPHVLALNLAAPQTPIAESPSLLRSKSSLLSVDTLTSQLSGSAEKAQNVTTEPGSSNLNTRNLLCLRALLNLAIALGPTLGEAWSIIFENLQQADIVLAMANSKSSGRDSKLTSMRGESSVNFNSEVNAVQAAASRLFESTIEYPNEAFLEVLAALCGLLKGQNVTSLHSDASQSPEVLKPRHQRRVGSYSGISVNSESDNQDYLFALGKVGDLVALNLNRMTSYEPSESGWEIICTQLKSIVTSTSVSGPARLLAADILSRIVSDSISTTSNEESPYQDIVQRRALSALYIKDFYQTPPSIQKPQIRGIDLEVHKVLIDALITILERSGGALIAGWDVIFDIILTTFWDSNSTENHAKSSNGLTLDAGSTSLIAVKLSRAAFSSVQLICSDFLSAVPDPDLSKLVDILHRFCSQEEDLNLSFTTTTFFWNVSDFLHNRMDIGSLEQITTDGTDAALFAQIMTSAREGTVSAIWLQLLLRLALNTVDERLEVRNGAVQTVLRIFENCGDTFTPKAWDICIQSVLIGMVQLNLEAQLDLRDADDLEDNMDTSEYEQEVKEWNLSTKLVMEGTSKLVASYIDQIQQSPAFMPLWQRLMGFLQDFLGCKDHEINTAIFTAVGEILGKLSLQKLLPAKAMDLISSLWMHHFPSRCPGFASTTNDKAFEAYLDSFRALYKLVSASLDHEELDQISQNILRCIFEADCPAYIPDVDSMTRVQQLAMDCLSMIQTDVDGAASILINVLSDMSRLPFTKIDDSGRRLSFVALAKAAMQRMGQLITNHAQEEEIFESGAILSALTSVVQPISLKYRWRQQGKAPGITQDATSTSLVILTCAIQRMKTNPTILKEQQEFWHAVIMIADGIVSADCDVAPLDAGLERDEVFDMQAFQTLRAISTPLLGDKILSDDTRHAYCRSLFLNSIIYGSQLPELTSLDKEPLKDLYAVRLGQTLDPSPALRIRMAYLCFSELLSLVSVHDSSPERIKLARAAAPYLILRAAVPIKAYIADQPLRGRMPMPLHQRDELLFVLREFKDLKSEPSAMPDAPGVRSLYKKHLHRIYPLLVMAIKVAKRDPVVLDALQACVDVVGQGFMALEG